LSEIRSFCLEHDWQDELLDRPLSKYSIFKNMEEEVINDLNQDYYEKACEKKLSKD